MKIVFLRDFRGVLAYEHVYKDGDEAELPDEIAQHLIDKGRAFNAEAVEEPEKPKKGKGKAAIYG